MPDAFVDTNVFLHAYTGDARSLECARFLAQLEAGTLSARLEDYVLHELSYIWQRYFRQATRDDVALELASLLAWPGVLTRDREELTRAVRRWQVSPLGFVDALLIERALGEQVPVYTKNVRDFVSSGIEVPDPLPG